MPIISIQPNQIFKIPLFTGFYSVMMILAVFSIIMLTVYLLGIKKVTDSNGKKYYRYPSSSLLISSLCFSLMSLITAFVCLGYYYSIFRFQNSFSFVSSLLVMGIDCATTGTSLYFLLKVKSYCPNPNDEFSTQFERCVPQCKKGTLLDEKTFVCIEGCRTDSDCPDGQSCKFHECCDLSTHTLTNNQSFCCPKEDVFCLSSPDIDTCPETDLVCCSSKVICKNDKGEPVCCADSDAICKDTGKGGQFCAVKCGNEVCSDSEVCVITDIFGNKTYKCEQTDLTGCTRKGDPFYFPDAIQNFYPAYKPIDSSKLDDVLQCDPNDAKKCDDQLKQAFHTDDVSTGNRYGYICGVPEHDGVNFESHSFNGGEKCTIQSLLQNNAIPGKTDKAYLKYSDDGSNVLFNIRNVVTDKGNTLSQPQSVFTTKTSSPTKNNITSSKNTVNYFQGKIPTILSNEEELCTSQNSYEDSCDPDFNTCQEKKQCPFKNTDDQYDCVYEDNTGIINKKAKVIKTVCVPKQSLIDEYGQQVLRITGYEPCDCFDKECSNCGGYSIEVGDVDNDCNHLFVDPNSDDIGKKYINFDPEDGCNYSGNWNNSSYCNAKDALKKGITTYEYTSADGSKKSHAMQPVIYFGDFYGSTSTSCTHDASRQNVLVRMCDTKNFQKTIDAHFEDVGQIVRPEKKCGIDAGYNSDSWDWCSPERILWPIQNAGEATGGDCNPSVLDYWSSGCGSRCTCYQPITDAASHFYHESTDWIFKK